MERSHISTSALLGEPGQSNTDCFVRAVAYSAFQAPVNGLGEIFDKLNIAEPLLPAIQFVQPPAEAEFGSVAWHYRQAGSAIGMALPFLLVHKGVTASSKSIFGQARANHLKGLVVAEAGVTGAVFDGLLRQAPCDNGTSFVESRLANATAGSLTMMAMAGSTLGLQSLSKASRFTSFLQNEIAASTLAGIPAGFVHAQATSVLNDNRLATGKELTESIYSFAALGGMLSVGRQSLVSDMVRVNAEREKTLTLQRDSLLQEKTELNTRQKELIAKVNSPSLQEFSKFPELLQVAGELTKNSERLTLNAKDSIRLLESSLRFLKQTGKTSIAGASKRSLEIALDHALGWMPQTKGSPFYIRDPRLDCSIPLHIRGKILVDAGLDVVQHTIDSVARPTELSFIFSSSQSFRGRANSQFSGQVILNFRDLESRVPVYDHELGHVLDATIISERPELDLIIKQAYEADLANAKLEPLVKEVLGKSEYVPPRPEQADPIDRVLPRSLRRSAYYSCRAEVIAESYKLYVRWRKTGATMSFSELARDWIDNSKRLEHMLAFESTYAALKEHLFDPLYLEEMSKRVPRIPK